MLNNLGDSFHTQEFRETKNKQVTIKNHSSSDLKNNECYNNEDTIYNKSTRHYKYENSIEEIKKKFCNRENQWYASYLNQLH